MASKRKRWIVAAVLVAVVGGGVALFLARRGPKATPVQLAAVGREDLQAKVTANGRVQAQRKVDISATIPGQITQLAVDEGDVVTKGQLLLQIDASNPRAVARSSQFSMQALRKEIDSARATRDQAKIDVERAEINFQGGIAPLAEVQRARTALYTAEAGLLAVEQRVEEARAMLEGARDTLAKTTVRSPIDGVVTARRVEEGEVAVVGVQNSPGTVLLTISDMSVVEPEMEVDETSIPQVAVGQEALLRIDAYPNRTFSGVVTEVGGSPLLGTNPAVEAIKFKVKIRMADPPPGIKPGLSVQADVLTGFRARALTVPIQALVLREKERQPGQAPIRGEPRDEEGVWVVEKGKVAFRPIRAGMLGELSVEVLSGLAGGETIVTGPFRALRSLKPGDAVREDKAVPADDETSRAED
jgi:HlyD family secretion protein